MKRKWPKTIRRYPAAPYRQVVWLARTRKDFTAAQEFISKQHDEHGGEGLTATYYSKGGGIGILIGWFNDDPATLAHECSHAVWKILGNCGVEVGTDNNEAFCYLLGDMIRKFWSKRK